MSTFEVKVVQISEIQKHDNADSLSIMEVNGCPIVFKTDEFPVGSKAAWIPVDAVVSTDLSGPFSFLNDGRKTTHRVKAKRLRGRFSMGFFIPSKPEWEVGQDVTKELGITKYEEPEPVVMNSDNESNPGFICNYTDIESYRKYKNLFKLGESVVISEKLHGANAKFIYRNDRLWVGSHRMIKKPDDRNLWWKMAKKEDLENKLKLIPDYIFYGEIFGSGVQDLTYGCKNGEQKLEFFDIFDISKGRYLNYDDMSQLLINLGLVEVPLLYNGPFEIGTYNSIEHLSEQNSLYGGMREGCVIKPTGERFEPKLNSRLILKYHSERYLTRKGGTEGH